jgi:uncharacterized protein YceH (UPF0502 family)
MERSIQLDPFESRVFGVLVEKALTTPDQYPLTLNSTLLGANQKSNRDPILTLEEYQVEGALDRLIQKYLARRVFPGNSRVEKYCHNGKDGLGLDAPSLAIVAELLMRGPQTAGELRGRAGRMASIESLDQLAQLLAPLIEHGMVRSLPPAPGSRAERYAQLLCPDLHPLDAKPSANSSETSASPGLAARVDTLEAEVASLREQLAQIVARLGSSGSG